MYAGVCGAMVCANLGFTAHSVSLLLPLQATRSQSIWRGLEELQVNILIRTNIFRCSCVSTLFTSWYCLLKSWSIVHGYLHAEHIQLWNRGCSLSYGVRVE